LDPAAQVARGPDHRKEVERERQMAPRSSQRSRREAETYSKTVCILNDEKKEKKRSRILRSRILRELLFISHERARREKEVASMFTDGNRNSS
jgi:hypothetical protein